MSTGSYEFPLGDFTCICLSDGSLDYPLQNFFANVPLQEIEAALKQRNLPTDYITTPYTYLFVDTREHNILVDMGAGKLGPRTGKLMQSFQAAGIDPESIDTVVITHAHPDHIGGTLNDEGGLNYPNASYYISKTEWDFWFSDDALSKTPESFVTIARKNLGAIKPMVNLVEGEAETVPGVYVIPAPGHTPGHMVVVVVSGDQKLYYIGDAVIYPLHLEHPDWLPIYDIIPEQAATSKHSIFNQIANEGAWVVGQHFPPFPSLGHVVKVENGWGWQPIKLDG
jgi:glyoxylase-like metal-dependent hydrolase (beta-lactamase superfamily II)